MGRFADRVAARKLGDQLEAEGFDIFITTLD
jgi:hypothetical protein